MSNLKFPTFGKEESRGMFFGKSITFDREEFNEVASSAALSSAGSYRETEFIERLKEGDQAAFDELVSRYTTDIFNLLYRLSQDAEEARDLTQETFLRIVKSVKNFRGDADLKTWIYRIAVNESRNRFRWWKRRHRSSTVSLDADDSFGEYPLGERLAGDTENPEDRALRRERQQALRDALQKLPANYREAIVLRDIEGLSYEEVARALDANLGTVKSRIARGREELRRLLEGL